MGKFNAATAVEPMEFDFTAFGGGAGIIPEPSQGALETFFDDMANVQKEFSPALSKMKDLDTANLSDEEKMQAIESVDIKGQLAALNRAIGDAIERLTGGAVTSNDVAALPFRVQQAFVDWITSELRPEKKAPGTRP